jgi:hypothetical protein
VATDAVKVGPVVVGDAAVVEGTGFDVEVVVAAVPLVSRTLSRRSDPEHAASVIASAIAAHAVPDREGCAERRNTGSAR